MQAKIEKEGLVSREGVPNEGPSRSYEAHTPGPWAIFGDGETCQLVIMPAGRPGDIATIQCPSDVTDKRNAECAANARLIRAAPEMFKALLTLATVNGLPPTVVRNVALETISSVVEA